jgi:hypothetical protein
VGPVQQLRAQGLYFSVSLTVIATLGGIFFGTCWR